MNGALQRDTRHFVEILWPRVAFSFRDGIHAFLLYSTLVHLFLLRMKGPCADLHMVACSLFCCLLGYEAFSSQKENL